MNFNRPNNKSGEAVDRLRLLEREYQLEAGLIYLNHAALGPWPRRTVRAVREFANENGCQASRGWKLWYAAEQRLRQRLACLLNAAGADDIALMKNTSEALCTIANGIDWRAGDQVLVLAEEFPSNIWPWQQAADESAMTVRVVRRQPDQAVHQALADACDNQTRLIAVSSVQFVSGRAADLGALGEHCRHNGIILVVDAIQSVGALAMDVRGWHIDALAAGSHKWLLAPEGIGVLYTSEKLRRKLRIRQAGWRMTAEPFKFAPARSALAPDSRRFEIGTLNTLGIMGLDASLSLYEELGGQWIDRQVRANTNRLVNGLRRLPVTLASADSEIERSGIVSFALTHGDATRRLFGQLTDLGVMAALRNDWLRLSPHYHTPAGQLDSVLASIERLLP